MRIGYYVPPTLLAHAGIRRRVDATIAAWERLGHEAVLVSHPAPGGSPFLAHIAGDARCAHYLARGGFGDLDHLHVRLFLPTPSWLRIPAGLAVSLEIQAGLRRAESARDLVRVVGGAPTARWLVRRARMGAFITSEFSRYPEYARVPRKVVIGNGVQLRDPYPVPTDGVPTIGMVVGTPATWHGLDRFAALARALPGYAFTVIGPREIEGYITGVTDGTPLRPTITAGHDDYEAALARLNVAVGSLALERKGLTEAAPLKVRDYVRAGIPTVLGYRDTNLSGLGDPAILQWDAHDVGAFSRWADENMGARVGQVSRDAISIDRIEAERVAAMADGTGSERA